MPQWPSWPPPARNTNNSASECPPRCHHRPAAATAPQHSFTMVVGGAGEPQDAQPQPSVLIGATFLSRMPSGYATSLVSAALRHAGHTDLPLLQMNMHAVAGGVWQLVATILQAVGTKGQPQRIRQHPQFEACLRCRPGQQRQLTFSKRWLSLQECIITATSVMFTSTVSLIPSTNRSIHSSGSQLIDPCIDQATTHSSIKQQPSKQASKQASNQPAPINQPLTRPINPNQLINQSVNQSTSQSINQSTIQSISRSNQSVNQSIHQSINRSDNQSINQSFDRSIHQSINRSIDQISINRSNINQSVNRSINQSINRSIDQI